MTSPYAADRSVPTEEPLATPRAKDKYGRFIFNDREVPDPWTSESRLAQWHGRTCGPWTVIGGLKDDAQHRMYCDNGWTRSGDWSFVCSRCHPDAVDDPSTQDHQRRPSSTRDEAGQSHPTPGEKT